MNELLNIMRMQAAMQGGNRASTRIATVSSYDPENYCAKVIIQPDDVETGWLPVTSPWVGNGWGLFAPPAVGDMVEVQFQEGSIEAGFIVGRFYNDKDRPLATPGGEFWLVHKSGSLLKFHNDGSVELVAAGTLSSTAPQWNHSGPVHITGNVQVTGNVNTSGTTTSAGQIIGQGGMAISGGTGATVSGDMEISGGNVTADGISLKTHKHSGVQPGGGITGNPQ